MNEAHIISEDLKKHAINFQKLKQLFDGSNHEHTIIQNHIKLLSGILEKDKECERRQSEQLRALQNICNAQEKTISELYSYRESNGLLTQENLKLLEENKELNAKITHIENARTNDIQNMLRNHKVQLESAKHNYENKVQDIKNELELVQASSDIRCNDIQNEMISMKSNYETKLKKAHDIEQSLRQQIHMLNNHMSTNIGIYQKKVFEMEQKVQTMEQGKAGTVFTSAQIMTNSKANTYPKMPAENSETSIENKLVDKYTNNCNKSNNVAKKFKFKKAQPNEPKLDSHMKNDFYKLQTVSRGGENVFEDRTVKEENQFCVENYDTIPTKENSSGFSVECSNKNNKVNFTQNVTGNAGKGSKPEFPVVKRRKLFVPNSDYMELK